MNKLFIKKYPLYLLFFLLFSCKTAPINVNYKNYKIATTTSSSNTFSQMLSTYKDSLDKSMNEVIGFSINGLTKKQPESVLGNFMTDAFKQMAEKKYNKKITAAFVNFGGIRSYLPKGDITIGKIFELMPFDNVIVLQNLTGKQFKEFLDKACEKGGWPVSAGFKYSIKDKKVQEAFVNDIAINDDSTYTIANSDYIANGGDNCEMLKNIPKINVNYLMRDAIIDYIRELTINNKTVDAKTENRVVYAK